MSSSTQPRTQSEDSKSDSNFDTDFAIIGSGFGGSVSAMRLSEKGYKVTVLEMGKRYSDSDFAKSSWDLRKFFWEPKLSMYGILQMTILRDAGILHGAGVGGGSLVYANTLLVPPDEAFKDPRWVGFDWKAALLPHYETAKRMLGAVPSPIIVETDRILKSVATDLGRGHTFHHATVGVFFGEPGQKAPDPYFDGKGPERTGCTLCGGCMVGCRVGAKNTLEKNYLFFAEKNGTTIVPETRVVDIKAIPNGYELTLEKSTGLFASTRKLRARGLVLSAGSLGTVNLLMRCKDKGSLPNLSSQLGNYMRTNSEALLGVRSRRNDVDHSKGIAITSGAFVDEKTHIEIVRYPEGSDSMSMLTTILTDDGPGVPRWLRWLGNVIKHPIDYIRMTIPFGWAKRTAILLVMQPLDNHFKYVLRRPWWWPFSKRLDSDRGTDNPAPVYIPIANEVAKRMAEKMDGIPQSSVMEVLGNKASTAHILGGCPIGLTPDDGVVDPQHRVFGYQNMFVVDGSTIPANLGVNPSLTITAMAEHAMSHIAPKNDPAGLLKTATA